MIAHILFILCLARAQLDPSLRRSSFNVDSGLPSFALLTCRIYSRRPPVISTNNEIPSSPSLRIERATVNVLLDLLNRLVRRHELSCSRYSQGGVS
jgi:hypothetical protein